MFNKFSISEYISISFFSFVIGLFGIVFSLYTYFFAQQKNLQITLLDKIDLVNVNEPLKKIDFKYDGRNIYDEKLSLQLLQIKFENFGSDINELDFSDKSIFGIELVNGEIIELRDFKYSNKYLKNELKPNLDNKNLISFQKIMIDTGNYFIANFVVLRNSESNLELNVLGKISGQSDLVVSYEKPKDNFDTLTKFYHDYTFLFSISVIILSVLITIVLVILFAFISLVLDKIYEFINNYKTNKYFGNITTTYRNQDLQSIYYSLIYYNKSEKSDNINEFLYRLYKTKQLKLFEYYYNKYINDFVIFYNEYYKLKNKENDIKTQLYKEDLNTFIDKDNKVTLLDILDINKYKTFNYLLKDNHISLINTLARTKMELDNLLKQNSKNMLFPQNQVNFSNEIMLANILDKNIFLKKNTDNTIAEDRYLIEKVESIISFYKIKDFNPTEQKIIEVNEENSNLKEE